MTAKRYISMLLVMLVSVTGAYAQMTFIKDVKVSGRSTDGNYNNLISEGYTVVTQSDGTYFDFNGGGTGGDYVYIGYKTTTNVNEAISDLAIIYNLYGVNPDFGTDDFLYGGSKTMMIGNKRYYLAPHSGGPDMNYGNTHKHINSVYLYYTRDVNLTDGTKLLTVIEGRSWGNEQTTVPDGWDSMIHGYQDYEYYGTNGYKMRADEKMPFGDTNYGGGGNYRYILCNYADVHYVDTDGQMKYPNAVTEITNTSNTLNAGWYIVRGQNVQTGTLTCNGAVNIILADGAKLTATGQANNPGIQVLAAGSSLAIYGQTAQSGHLIATIILDKQGGEGGSERITGTYNAAMPQIAVPIRTGYTFNGCYSEPNGGGIKYYNADGTNARAWDNANHTTLYAYWTPNQYTVTLDKQKGEGGSDSVTATYDAPMPQITVPTSEDYEFLGYFSQLNGRGTKYYNADGTSANVWNVANNTTTLYAQWKLVRPHYIDADGSKKFITEYTEITDASSPITLSSGWYIVKDANVRTTTLVCEGAVHIILLDGAKLTATSRNDAGIRVSAEDASLTIYGQTNQSGQLIANGGGLGAGIGGAFANKGHDITINGGVIIAKGEGPASAIGGGYNASSSNIFINSSLILWADSNNPPLTVISHTSDEDMSEKLLNIPCAIVRTPAKNLTISFDKQSGIGGEDQLNIDEGSEMPTITVPTRNGYSFRGYFTGQGGSGVQYYNIDGTGTIPCNLHEDTTLYAYWIPKCIVTLDQQGGSGGTSQITAIYDAPMPTITIPSRDGYIFQGYYTGQNGTGKKYYKVDGTCALPWDLKQESCTLYACWKEPAAYVDADGTTKYVSLYETITNATTTLTEGWYIVSGGDVKTNTLVCSGEVHLILADGCKLTATGSPDDAGIRVSAEGTSLTIYGQTNQSGQLIANGDWGRAGIGGVFISDGHHITINGGVITATGGASAAGIGGGARGSASDITINGGVVTAIAGSQYAAGIGGGYAGLAREITINGGVVTAIGGSNASGIGGGIDGSASNIFINASLILKADGNATPSTVINHTSKQDVADLLNGKQYATITPNPNPTSVLTAVNRAEGMDSRYGTFYSSEASYQIATDDATIFTASVGTINGETCLILHKLAGDIIPIATPVILKSEGTKNKLQLDIYTNSISGITIPDNSLSGTNTSMKAPANCYIMSYGQNGLGFYKYDAGKDLSAHKAYLIGSATANPTAMTLEFEGNATGNNETDDKAKTDSSNQNQE